MREIKFRGRSSKDNKTWFTGSLVSLTDIDEAYIDHYDGLRRVIERYPVNPATVGQFTGLLDSNGKEIFEGDILRFAPPLRWEDDEREVGVVVFKYYAFVVKFNDMFTGLFTLAANEAPYTIIGNIHDNPNLLGAEDARNQI